jgi:hypothetical protein
MAMVKAARTFLLAVVLCSVTAAPAHAAFFPELTVAISPGTPSGTPALTAMIAQPATDTPIERFTLSLPAGFKAKGAPGASACVLTALRTGACTPQSQVGVFGAQLGRGAPFSGTIHRTGPKSFALAVSVLGGAVRQVVEGSLVERANGALDLRLDQLPALPLTQLGLRFWGGGRSFIETPARCGTYTVDGKFTSRLAELAIDRTLMPIEGCAGVPVAQVANIRLSETSFRAGGSIYGTRTIIAWWTSDNVEHTDIRIERRVRGAWQPVGILVATGNAGDNKVRWDGRLKGRALKPGRYGLRVQPAGSEPAKLVRFRILR